MAISSIVDRAGRWFLASGIQEGAGGVARYYRTDTERNLPVSTEITGYAASTLVYLHSLTGRDEYLDRAAQAARFLTQVWNEQLQTIPFESAPPGNELAYFFDAGIIIRGLLAVWRACGERRFLEVAQALGRSMARDFAAGACDYYPIVRLPRKLPLERNAHWSRSSGCYQLKSAMAWHDLFEACGEREFQDLYEGMVRYSLADYAGFLPGNPDQNRVMDRLHAFSYFLEGLLPCAGRDRCAAALCDGIGRAAGYLRQIGPTFARSDVYAQVLRVRIFADRAGMVPLDREAAEFEAAELARFQLEDPDARISGGFYFGRKAGELMPFVNPVSTGFGVQALAMWEQYQAGGPDTPRYLLI